jgi:hypothetical protein
MGGAIRTCFFTLSVALPISVSFAAIMFGCGFVFGISIKVAILQLVAVMALWTISGLLLLWVRSKEKNKSSRYPAPVMPPH